VKPADRVGQCPRVLSDRSGDPGMGKLEQQRAARSEKYRRFPIDVPHHRLRAERARRALGCGIADDRELALQIGFANDP
jgi:hypothetical protein